MATHQNHPGSRPIQIMNIPCQVGPEHGFDPGLVGFPLNLLYASLIPPLPVGIDADSLAAFCACGPKKLLECPELAVYVRLAWYFPHPASFVEDARVKQLMYNPALPSPYSVSVVFNKEDDSWETHKYRNDESVLHSSGRDFRLAMAQATLGGPKPDEVPADWFEQLRALLL